MLKAHFNKKLWHFTLEFHLEAKNQIIVLWGPSGSGKTTVLHCLAGLRKPTEGYIILDDQVLYSSSEKVDLATRFRNIGYLFQDYSLFPHMTVKQNVFYGLKTRKIPVGNSKDDLIKLLDSFGVAHLIDRYPRQLSGGEKQRVALARALAVRPRLLLLDEPLNALDKSTKISLRREIRELHAQWQIPFILVTHDEEDASTLGDIVISIKNGRSREVSWHTQSL